MTAEIDDLTRPPRRTESCARRQAARAFRAATPPAAPASISQTYRDGGGSGAIRIGGRCARLCAGADARDLCRGHGQPECAGARSGQTLRRNSSARCRRRAGNGDLGCGRSLSVTAGFRTARRQRARCARWRWASSRDSFRLRDVNYERGEARAALTKADAADLVVASYMIGEISDAERTRTRRTDVGKNPRHAARGRTRHACRLCPDHRAA